MTTVSPESSTRTRDLRWLFPALVLVALVFAVTLTFSFVNWDDDTLLLRNPLVTGASPVPPSAFFTTPSFGYPIPVSVAAWRAEFTFAGPSAWHFHLVNALLHLASCAVLFALARSLSLGRAAATFTVLLFALHPVVAEPVAWVTGRKDLLATLFALLLALRVRRAPRAFDPLALGLFALAAFSKPSVLGLPLALAVWPTLLDRAPLSRGILRAVPLVLVSLAAAVAGYVGQSRVGALVAVTLPVRLRTAWYALGFHLDLLVGARPWSARYVPPLSPASFTPAVDLAPVVALVLVGLCVWRAGPSRRRTVLAALAFAVAAYLPQSNLVPLVRFVAQSYVYLALAGLALALGATVDRVIEAPGRAPSVGLARRAIALGVVGLLAVPLLGALGSWHDSVALWTNAIESNPPNGQLCRQLGNALVEQGQLDRALALYGGCRTQFNPALFDDNIGRVLLRLGRIDEARAHFRRVVARDPSDAYARAMLDRLSE